MPKIIEAEWDLFRKEILRRENTGPAQLRDARHAFYAGAWAMYALLVNRPDTEAMLAAVDGEMREFAARLEKGEA